MCVGVGTGVRRFCAQNTGSLDFNFAGWYRVVRALSVVRARSGSRVAFVWRQFSRLAAQHNGYAVRSAQLSRGGLCNGICRSTHYLHDLRRCSVERAAASARGVTRAWRNALANGYPRGIAHGEPGYFFRDYDWIWPRCGRNDDCVDGYGQYADSGLDHF